MDMAQGFWQLLIPCGLQNGALSHIIGPSGRDGDDVLMSDHEEGWRDEYTDWWFDCLNQKGMKGVSKDVWQRGCTSSATTLGTLTNMGVCQFLEFVRTIDAKFEKHDLECTSCYSPNARRYLIDLLPAAWPSTIDEFVEYARKRLGKA